MPICPHRAPLAEQSNSNLVNMSNQSSSNDGFNKMSPLFFSRVINESSLPMEPCFYATPSNTPNTHSAIATPSSTPTSHRSTSSTMSTCSTPSTPHSLINSNGGPLVHPSTAHSSLVMHSHSLSAPMLSSSLLDMPEDDFQSPYVGPSTASACDSQHCKCPKCRVRHLHRLEKKHVDISSSSVEVASRSFRVRHRVPVRRQSAFLNTTIRSSPVASS